MVRHRWTSILAVAISFQARPTAQDNLQNLQGPLVTIGDDLHQVRGGAILSDQRIVIANSGNRELRLYSRDGRLIRTIGRPGEGPAEFRAVTNVIVDAADSIFVFDWLLRRISVFSSNGEYARSVSTAHLTAGVAQPDLIGFFGRNEILVGLRASIDPTAKPGIQRPEAKYLLIDRQGRIMDTVATVPDAERWVRHATQAGAFLTAPLPFGKTTSVAVNSANIIFADQGSPEIRVVNRRGVVARASKSPWPSQPLRSSDVEKYKEWRLANVPEVGRAGEQRTLAEVPIPTSSPSFGRVHSAMTGELLIERFRAVPSDPGEAVLLSRDGRQMLKIRVPAKLEIMWIGEGLLLALTKDELDVEAIAVYRIPAVN